MDKQFAAAVILIIFGFAMTQMGQNDSSSFLTGLGVGTIIIASVWIVRRIISDIKKNQNDKK